MDMSLTPNWVLRLLRVLLEHISSRMISMFNLSLQSDAWEFPLYPSLQASVTMRSQRCSEFKWKKQEVDMGGRDLKKMWVER